MFLRKEHWLWHIWATILSIIIWIKFWWMLGAILLNDDHTALKWIIIELNYQNADCFTDFCSESVVLHA